MQRIINYSVFVCMCIFALFTVVFGGFLHFSDDREDVVLSNFLWFGWFGALSIWGAVLMIQNGLIN